MQKGEVIDYFGGVRATARALTAAGYPKQGGEVSQWPETVPELQARRIAEITRGAVALRLEDYRREVA